MLFFRAEKRPWSDIIEKQKEEVLFILTVCLIRREPPTLFRSAAVDFMFSTWPELVSYPESVLAVVIRVAPSSRHWENHAGLLAQVAGRTPELWRLAGR
jgi:hypothetical protein